MSAEMPETLQRVLQFNSCEQPLSLLLCTLHASLLDENFISCRLPESSDVYRVEFNRGTKALIKLKYRHSQSGQPGTSHQDLICTLSVNALADYVIANGSVDGCCIHQVTLSERAYTKTTLEGLELHNQEELWMILKNQFAWPLRCDMYTALGLTPPTGLLLLPQELVDKVLHVLEAKELLRLACSCKALKRMIQSSSLWEQLTQEEFGDHLQPADMLHAEQYGWMRTYKQKLLERNCPRWSRGRLRGQFSAGPWPSASGVQVPWGLGHQSLLAGIRDDIDRLPQLPAGFRNIFGGRQWSGSSSRMQSFRRL